MRGLCLMGRKKRKKPQSPPNAETSVAALPAHAGVERAYPLGGVSSSHEADVEPESVDGSSHLPATTLQAEEDTPAGTALEPGQDSSAPETEATPAGGGWWARLFGQRQSRRESMDSVVVEGHTAMMSDAGSQSETEPSGVDTTQETEGPPSGNGSDRVAELEAELSRLTEKLQQREKHLDSLREQRNELHQQLRQEQQEARERMQSLEEELARSREPAVMAEARIRELEAELAQNRGQAEAIQQQSQQEREAWEARLRELESELQRVREALGTTQAEVAAQQEEAFRRLKEEKRAVEDRVHALEAELNQSRSTGEASGQRAQELEAEFGCRRAEAEEAHARLNAEKAAAEAKAAELQARLQALEANRGEQPVVEELRGKVEELNRLLSAREEERARTRGQSHEVTQAQDAARRALTQLRDLEIALKQAEARATELQLEVNTHRKMVEALQAERKQPAAASAAGRRAAGADVSGEKLAELYNQTVTPLTVLVASADMLAMAHNIDPSLRDTAVEMKEQAQVLMDILQKHTRPK